MLGVVPAWALRAVGAVHRDTRELAETVYQFTRPFVLDSTRSEDLLRLRPTPVEEGTAGDRGVVAPHATA